MARRLKLPDSVRSERPDVDREGLASLSSREQQVLSLAAEGFIDKEISSELGVSLNTLRTYWSRIRSKAGEVPRSALAVAYVGQTSNSSVAEKPDGPDWEIDLGRWMIRRISNRANPWESEVGVEVSLDYVLSLFHPLDEPRVRGILDALSDNDASEFTYSARTISPDGIGMASAIVRVVREADGKPTRLFGRRVPNLDLRAPSINDIEVGYWQRDLPSGTFTGDDAFCRIFHVNPNSPNLLTDVRRKFHPDEKELTASFVSNAVAAGKDHARATHRLLTTDGSFRWATTDLRIEYDAGIAVRALGTVMVFS
jgi:DNA-binding CsgD family transcriptional regulator/PAS domain-containing protein